MTNRLLVLFIVGLLISGSAIYAHHSFAGTYTLTKKITIEGKLVQLMIRNPHSFLQIEVRDQTGKVDRWAVETGGATQLQEVMPTDKEPLKVGDHMKVTGNPARSAEAYRILGINILRPSDGWAMEFVERQ